MYRYREMDGLEEASMPPSEHDCAGILIDVILSRRRLVLICYTCGTFWHTALLGTTSNSPSLGAMLRAAETLYEEAQYRRMRQLREAREDEVAGMYALYCRRGMSLSEIGRHYGITRQVVFDKFQRRGFRMRTREKLPPVIFNGRTYTLSGKGGCYRLTSGARSLLHRDVWEFHCGPIPPDHDILHRDGDKANNDLSNLVCVTREEALAAWRPAAADISNPPHCRHCGKVLHRKQMSYGLEYPAALMRRQYCDQKCFGLDHRGKRGGDES